jgi:hypothetical protein
LLLLLLLLVLCLAHSISYTASTSATLRSFVTANATRGSYTVSVNNTSRLNITQW